MKPAFVVAPDAAMPSRVSTRLRERRQRFDMEQEQQQAALELVVAAAAPSSPPISKKSKEKKVSDKKETNDRTSPVRKKKRTNATATADTGDVILKKKQAPPASPATSPSRAGTKKKKKLLSLPCNKPPYPFYPSPSESRPTFAQGMESVVHILRTCRNIAVLTGAGISVSCGIPDFRSSGTGLYSVLDCAALGLSCPEELFDWEFFQNNPEPFFQFAKRLYFPLENNQKVRPSDSHKLLRLLQDRKQLLRVYTQNIDGLEEEAGVVTKKVVYAHGSLKWATCLTCKRKMPSAELEQSILEGAIPHCPVIPPSRSNSKSQLSNNQQQPNEKSEDSTSNSATLDPKPIVRREPSARQRKRPHSLGMEYDDDDTNSGDNESERQTRSSTPTSPQRPTRQCSNVSSSSSTSNRSSPPPHTCGGILKPNVTFFGQTLPDAVSRCLESDRKKVDALIVIGTSLSVAPISKVIGYLPAHIPRILINRTIVHPRGVHDTDNDNKTNDEEQEEEPDFRDNYVFDAYLLGNCDDVTRALVKRLRAEEQDTEDTPLQTVQDDLEEMGRLLSEVRHDAAQENNIEDDDGKDDDSEVLYHAEEWETATVPAERVFLFPGAQPPTSSTEETVMLREVCHCNACAKRIVNGHIHKCLQCFDFDLCHACFPKVSKNHYEGQHQFGKERIHR